MPQYDVLIIGGGIVGAFVARELSRYDLRVLVLEREDDLGEGSAKANSGLLYPGFHPRGGSLKGRACAEGNAMYDEICAELGIPLRRVGSLYVAFHPGGEEMIEEKYRKGIQNGVPGMEILSGDAARRIEPLLSSAVTRALYAPTAALISPFELIVAVARSAASNGVAFRFGAEVLKISPEADQVRLVTSAGEFTGAYVVNAAGENADVLEGQLRPQRLVIRPRRGEFYVFDKRIGGMIQHVLYQAQESDEGGTLLAPTIDGNLIAGPTSQDVPDYRHTQTTQAGLAHVARVAKKLVPTLDIGQVIASFAGVRANIKNLDKEQKDFFLSISDRRVLSALGIKNPGMTAAPSLAKRICKMLAEQGLVLHEKTDWKPGPKRMIPFLQQTPVRQRELYAQDPANAHVICRCEGITEGDILRQLRAPLPPHTLNGLKKRLRVGMGRCQGGFCTDRVIAIMCRELGCPPQAICKGRPGSNLVKGWVKP